MRCFICGERGHTKYKCPLYKGNGNASCRSVVFNGPFHNCTFDSPAVNGRIVQINDKSMKLGRVTKFMELNNSGYGASPKSHLVQGTEHALTSKRGSRYKTCLNISTCLFI